MLKLQEFFEGCHDADVHSGMYARLLEGKKPKDESKPNKPWRHNRNKPPERVDHRDRRNIDHRPTRIPAIREASTGGAPVKSRPPHAKTEMIGIDPKMTNLTKTIGDTPRLPTARTVRVDIKLTMWR
jgi:hypothetical protein